MKLRRMGLAAAGLALTTAGLAACGTTSSASAKSLATINGHPVTQKDVTNFVEGTEFMNQERFPTTATEKKAELKAVVAQQAVNDWVLSHHLTTEKKARTEAKTILSSEIQSSIGSSAELDSLLKQDHLSQSGLVQYLTNQVIAESAFQKVSKGVKAPTTAQEKAFYVANKSQFESVPQDKIGDIVVKSNSLAQSLLKQLKSGASFATLADKYSIVATKNGGNLGYLDVSTSAMSEGMYSAVQGMKAGQYTTYHGTKGYHVIWLEAVKPAAVEPFAKVQSTVKTDVTQNLDDQAYQKFVTSLEKKDTVHYAKTSS